MWEAMELLVAVKTVSVTYPAGLQQFLLFYIGLKFILYVLQVFSGRSVKIPSDMCRLVYVLHELDVIHVCCKSRLQIGQKCRQLSR